jgi:hypothetical protein
VLEIKGGSVKKRLFPNLLNAISTLPYHLRAGHYQCFGKTEPQGCTIQRPGPMAGGLLKQSLNGGLPYAQL